MLAVIARVCLVTIGLVVMAASINAQPSRNVAGRWVWKEVARRNQPQTQFTLVITRLGDKVKGTYSVDQFINGKWQGEDGN